MQFSLPFPVELMQEVDDAFRVLKTASFDIYKLVICTFAQSGKLSGMAVLDRIRKSCPAIPVISTNTVFLFIILIF